MRCIELIRSLQNSSSPSRAARSRRRSGSLTGTEALESRQLLTSFTTDIDDDGLFSPLTDGVIAFRYLSGQTGDSLTRGSVNPNGRRTDPAEILAFLETDEMQKLLDIDGDGLLSPLTDGVLIKRGLSGQTGESLTKGAANPEGTRSQSEHVQFVIDIASSIDDRYSATEGEVLTVSAADGVLQNDPPGSTIIRFDSTSAKLAAVVLNEDGSFTYDPRASETFAELTAANSISDSFDYTVRLPSNAEVTVSVTLSVEGRSSGNQDVLTTDDNTRIGSISIPKGGVPSEPQSLLANDAGTGLSVVDFTSVSDFGAVVLVQTDGRWRYDPTPSSTLNSLSVGESLTDRFSYTTQDSTGQQQQTTVAVEVSGANDAPIVSAGVFGEMTLGEDPLTLSLLDVANDPEGDSLSVTAVTPQGDFPGSAVLNGDGTITYTPSSELELAQGRVHRDIFTYTVEDQHGAQQSIAEIVVRVIGAANAPQADDDDFTFAPRVNTEAHRFPGVLDNDSDVDGNELILLNPGLITTERQATVQLLPDGQFIYDPRLSTELRSLGLKQVLDDSFTYTINDSEGHGESSATVTVRVFGDEPTNPEVDLSTAEIHSERNRTEVAFLVNGERVQVFDEVSGNLLLDLPESAVDRLKIIGTAAADLIYDPTGAFPIPVTIEGRGGNDVITGGAANSGSVFGGDEIFGGDGNDVIFGGTGVNTISGGPGADQFRDRGQLSLIRDLSDEDWLIPKLDNLPSPSDLQQVGELQVTLAGLTGVFETSVHLTGPSGYGWKLSGQWTVSDLSDGREEFVGTGVAMESAVGSIPLGDVTLIAGSDGIFGSGPLESADGGIFSAVKLLKDNPVINEFNNLTGFEFANPNLIADSNFDFGLKLGSELLAEAESNNRFKTLRNAPLNPAVPYLFATFGTASQGLELGSFSLSPTEAGGVDAGFVFVMDPIDPFFWVNGEVDGNKGAGFGWSKHGLIPFEPNKQPSRVSASEKIYGNIAGTVKFPFKAFDIEANAVLDYDREYGPGKFTAASPSQSLQAQRFIDLLSGNSADWETVIDVVTNTEFGINGAVAFNHDIKDSNLTLTIPVADGTAMFVDGDRIAFRGGSPDSPFGDSASILNDVLGSLSSIDVDGSVDFETGNFHLDVSSSSGGLMIGPFEMAGSQLDFTISQRGVEFSTSINTPVGSLSFDADIAFEEKRETVTNPSSGVSTTSITKPGVFSFAANAEAFTLDLGIASFSASAALSIDNWDISFADNGNLVISPGAVRLRLNLSGSADLTIAGISGQATIAVSSNGNFSGSARIDVETFLGDFSLFASVSNSGITFEVLGLDITIPFPAFQHIHPEEADPEFIGERLLESALPGIVDEALRRLERNGLTAQDVELLKTVAVTVEPVDDATQILGYAAGSTITLDDNAAGYGWFIDPTPNDDSEFGLFSGHAEITGDAYRRVDLLSVVMHEFTHILEFAHPEREFDFGEVGNELLSVGQRLRFETRYDGLQQHSPSEQSALSAEVETLDSVFEDLLPGILS